VRTATEALAQGLAVEDLVVQSMPDASPVKWHLAHTTWFFETFVLDGRPYHPEYRHLFNSYYEAVGARWTRAARGLLSRPTVAEVMDYRRNVDGRMREHLDDGALAERIELGLQHEQQHQELICTDLKHMLSLNPLGPVYRPSLTPIDATALATATAATEAAAPPLRWVAFDEGIHSIGWDRPSFAFDNERPRHRVLVPPFALASRLVSAGEYLAFIADGGYRRPELWLSDGWAAVNADGWQAPLYWRPDGEPGERTAAWSHFTLSGWRPVDPAEPVCHVSYYEADAYARWAEARLPTEAEWECAAAAASPATQLEGSFVESGRFHPAPAPPVAAGVTQLAGDCWQWTASAYAPYPGYRPLAGALGEYNGKFMCNQMVLRGASCVTPRGHARLTYRNFFPPAARWQFAGIRLAQDQ
jgi:ergothioneine biosynthesis protein EgtB